MRLIESLKEDDRVTSYSLIRSKQTRKKKNGDPFLRIVLGDRTGNVEARLWDNVEALGTGLKEGAFVEYSGRVETYNGVLQVILKEIRVIDPSAVPGLDIMDFVPSTDHDVEAMWARLLEIVQKHTRRPCVRELLELTLSQHGERFRSYPAAVEIHHNYAGGFLEHVVSLCESVLYYSGRFPALDVDLLVAGAVLHDIGKLEELSGPVGPTYTTVGNLIGHVIIGRDILRDAAAQIPEFPPTLLMLLEHMILSHQGQLEWGSPKRPKIPESIVLHYVDDLDAKLNRALRVIENSSSEGDFTERDYHLGRALFQGDYDESPPEASPGSPIPFDSDSPADSPREERKREGQSFLFETLG